jgi:hypothetical protein
MRPRIYGSETARLDISRTREESLRRAGTNHSVGTGDHHKPPRFLLPTNIGSQGQGGCLCGRVMSHTSGCP